MALKPFYFVVAAFLASVTSGASIPREARGALVLDGASSFPYLLHSVKDSVYCVHPGGGHVSQNADLLFYNDCDGSRPDLLVRFLDAGDGKFVIQSCASAPTESLRANEPDH